MIAHVDIDAFFPSVEQLLDPSLQGKPVIVGGSIEQGGVVSSASYQARRFGVHSAMPMARALKLCPHAVVVGSNFSAYKDFSRRVMSILEGFTPVVEVASIDEAYLDLKGTERLHGHPYLTACRIHQRVLRETGLSVSVGVAANPLLSKIASDMVKPAGVLLVVEGTESEFMAPLDVGLIPGVGPQSRKALRSIGVVRVADLRRIEPDFLTRTFGVWGRRLYEICRGIDHSRIGGGGPRKSISREVTFVRGRSDRTGLERTLMDLLADVTRRLRKLEKSARCITVKIRYTDFQTRTASRTQEQASAVDNDFRDPMVELFRKLFTRRMKLRLVGVGLSELREGTTRQGELFEGRRDRECARKIAGLLDKLSSRFGYGVVSRGVFNDETPEE